MQEQIPSNNLDKDSQPNDGGENSNGQLIQTNTYIWALGSESLDLSCDWNFSTFLRNHLGWFLENTVGPCRVQVEREMPEATSE